jgi:hypothetical protein
MKMLDKITNVAVILGVAVFIVVVARNQFIRPKLPTPPEQIVVGKTVTLPGVHFPEGRDSLVLALSTTCHFCKDSLPFYRDLTAKAQGHLNVIAVLPQPEAEATKYLHDAEVSTNQVVSTQLGTIGVLGTPTLLLVDNKGNVHKTWEGLLDQKGQEDVLAQTVGHPKSGNTLSSLFHTSQESK